MSQVLISLRKIAATNSLNLSFGQESKSIIQMNHPDSSVQSLAFRVQCPESRIQRPESSVQHLRRTFASRVQEFRYAKKLSQDVPKVTVIPSFFYHATPFFFFFLFCIKSYQPRLGLF